MKFFNFKSKSKIPTPSAPLPATWPSPLHNKCRNPRCKYPNSPQAAAGTYVCRGVPGGFFCESVFEVSPEKAAQVMNKHMQDVLREEEAKRRAEMEHQKAAKYQQEEAARQQAAADLAARYDAERRARVARHAQQGMMNHYHPPHQALERRAAQRKRPDEYFPLFDAGVYERPRLDIPRPPLPATQQVRGYHNVPQYQEAPQVHPSQAQLLYNQPPPPRRNHDRSHYRPSAPPQAGPQHISSHSSSRHDRNPPRGRF